jgi:guanylate cyclase soluble subunit alpha
MKCEFLRLLKSTPHFITEERPRECLPKIYPADAEGTCHFLNDYRHPRVSQTSGSQMSLEEHIRLALADLRV